MIHTLKRLVDKRPKAHGPRGRAMLGFAVLSAALSLYYVGPFATPDDTAPAFHRLFSVMPMEFWGTIWLVVAAMLVISAFRTNQAIAMGGFAGMLGVWGITYLIYFVEEMLAVGESRTWIVATLFLSLCWACFGVARMVNPAEEHVEMTTAPGPPETKEQTDGLA